MFSRFDYKRISSVMGDTSRTTYLTMIRDPVDIFVSAWHYYKFHRAYNMSLGNNQWEHSALVYTISPLSEEFARSGPEVTSQRKAGKEAKLGKYTYAVMLQSLNS